MAEEERDTKPASSRRMSWFERKTGFKFRYAIAATAGVAGLGLYVGDLFFGDASYEVLRHLDAYEKQLQKEIVRLKRENAKLQKAYFELKELSPQD